MSGILRSLSRNMSLVVIAGLVVLVTALSRIIRRASLIGGVRRWTERCAPRLAQLLACIRCLSFWLALACASWAFRQHDLWLDFALVWLLGWRGSYHLNNFIDKYLDQPAGDNVLLCCVCEAELQPQTRLERRGLLFCSQQCWFNFLRDQPRPVADLVDDHGNLIRQETKRSSPS